MKSQASRMKTAAIGAGVLVVTALIGGCARDQAAIDPQEAGDADLLSYVTTDKARYNPGDPVRFTLKMNESAGGGDLVVRYKHLDEIVEEKAIEWDGSPEVNWEWQPSEDDYRGYMTEIFLKQDKEIVDHANIAVDVSSDWGKFPRYGYLADFMAMEASEQEAVMERLSRYRINGIQFYDWQWKHHMPMKLEGEAPAKTWPEIANRPVAYDTVSGYIDLAHERNMKAMNYNLLFGAFEDSEQDGVKREWGLFKDPLLKNQDKHPLPDSWASDIMLLNPANEEWQSYLFREEKKVFDRLPFDGWHVDQLGDRGILYDANADKVNLPDAYESFMNKAKETIDVDYVMNAVGQFGQANIAKTPVKFLYTEVWDAHPQYRNLKEITDQNLKYSKGALNTVFAAYMNYDHANSAGEFNMPGVLLTDAVMFASGASHLELGENMLAKEYFPNRNLRMTEELQVALIAYYDFLTAYQNLLRDGTVDKELEVAGTEAAELSDLPERGKVWSFTKEAQGRAVLHLINFTDAKGMEWRDDRADQTEPKEIKDVKLTVRMDGKVKKAWVASPDYYGGSPVALDFEQKNGELTLTLPHLKYWNMVVLEY
ncbi:glycoside hydrolase family 66 protein [Paenibacillus sp. LHD-117]|uniref:glycoside hydrolase family 66 protein n=1 Tax=Paenibacillus sp. LHD-117 TaxID=3071412 RepID=UPI0027DF7740|nr:glycoside hydrolase family 66 protein [Paenibacillus sp. LHD-117]MDQ6419781.1 glycoside hydrolase family 66 protein [Paenibacillus sp. LHD-117]